MRAQARAEDSLDSEEAAREAAVDQDGCAGHVLRAVRGEEARDVAEFLWRAPATERYGLHVGFARAFGVELCEPCGLDAPRRHAVHGDPSRAEISRGITESCRPHRTAGRSRP